ncbi:alkyl hydroperoxide reductase [Micromonospora rosaria]|uniref:Alkyl hydroperoxide reductase n=1 Tax=Micromonospora rosaria TaxID=47874 RepID=A0A136PWJ8_9ACTN|nr:TlpA disulfide reductase family protein [Micromonospora rosaria]KXK62859.1 alkyl hydroperoxide reductase [Micromonospora rosaria]
MRARRWITALLAAATVTAGLVGCSAEQGEQRCTNTDGIIECAPEDRSTVPEVTGELLEGTSYDLASTRGQVVVVNFWGSWCNPCRAEADDLENTYQATKDSGVTFLGINVQDDRDKAIAFEESFKVTYPSLFDPASRLALRFDIAPNSIPATFILDRQGRIATVIRMAVTEERILPAVQKVAAEQAALAGPG